jgi:hypothetical protein
MKEFFFDRDAVIGATDAQTRKFLSQFGAFVRRTAQSSLKYRKKPARPGEPPSVHRSEDFLRASASGAVRATSPLKELIYFAYEPNTSTVYIGPVPFGGPIGVVPELLEKGGVLPARKNRRRMIRRVGGPGEIQIGKRSGRTARKNKDGVWVTYIKLRTQAQADRANRLNEELYGPLNLPPAPFPRRAFMDPAYQIERTKLPQTWHSAASNN